MLLQPFLKILLRSRLKVHLSLKKENKIKILAICKNNINAANLYLSYSVKLKEEWIGKVDFSVAVNFENAVAISTNENGVVV